MLLKWLAKSDQVDNAASISILFKTLFKRVSFTAKIIEQVFGRIEWAEAAKVTWRM
jgi:hypothetical protein